MPAPHRAPDPGPLRSGTRDVDDDTPRELVIEAPDAGAFTGTVRLLEASEQVASIGSWEWRPRPDILRWSDNMYRIMWFEPGEVTPSRDYILQRTHPDDRERMLRHMQSTNVLRNPPPVEFRIEHPTHGIRYLRSTIATIEWDADNEARVIGTVQDLTDEHLTVREIAAHLAVSKTLSEWGQLENPTVVLLRELGEALEFVFAALWLPRDRVLLPSAVWSEPALELGELEGATLPLRLPLGTGLPGRAWRSRQPETLADVAEDETIRRRLSARQSGLRGAVAIPAVRSDEVVAVLEFYHAQSSDGFDRLRRTMVAIGRELGEFLSRRAGQLGWQQLTPRQLDVLRLAAAGHTTLEIASALHLRPSTVRTHFDHVYEKLGVSARTAAVAQGLRLGLIE